MSFVDISPERSLRSHCDEMNADQRNVYKGAPDSHGCAG